MTFNESLYKVFLFSRQEAERLGNDYVSPEHFLLGLLRMEQCQGIKILEQCGIQTTELKTSIENQVRGESASVNEILSLISLPILPSPRVESTLPFQSPATPSYLGAKVRTSS